MDSTPLKREFTNYTLLTTNRNRQIWSEWQIHEVGVSLSAVDNINTANEKGTEFGKLLATNIPDTVQKFNANDRKKVEEKEFQGLIASALAIRFSSGGAAEGLEGLGWSYEVAQSFFRAAQYALIISAQ